MIKDLRLKTKYEKLGFTLIELLVVIAVIGLLSALMIANYNAARSRARDARRKADLDQIKKGLLLYYNDSYPKEYPPAIPAAGDPFGLGSEIYMKTMPGDPLDGSSYSYAQAGTPLGQDFCLSASLENHADQDIGRSQARCSGCGFGTYDYVLCVD